MSNLQRLSNTAFGIRKYLDTKGYDVGGKGRKPNEILVAFLKQNNLKYVKWNSRYKGLFTAELINASTVGDRFDLFKNWIQNQSQHTPQPAEGDWFFVVQRAARPIGFDRVRWLWIVSNNRASGVATEARFWRTEVLALGAVGKIFWVQLGQSSTAQGMAWRCSTNRVQGRADDPNLQC